MERILTGPRSSYAQSSRRQAGLKRARVMQDHPAAGTGPYAWYQMRRFAGNGLAQRILQPSPSERLPGPECGWQADAVTEPSRQAAAGTLRRCGGVPCPPGTCDHDGLLRVRRQSDSPSNSAIPDIVYDVLRSPGQSLDSMMRADMEARFGYDLGQVRLHTGDRAARSARAVHALGYTVGYDVVLGGGLGQLDAGPGRKVLMHELAHVVQHVRTPEGPAGGLVVGDPQDVAERDADAAAQAAEGAITAVTGPVRQGEADRSSSPAMMSGVTAAASSAYPPSRLRRQGAPAASGAPADASSCRILFQKASTATTDDAARDSCVETARQYFAAGGSRTITLHGFASEEGDPAFNTDLALRRAQYVKQLLMRAHVPDGAINVVGHGADRTYPGLEANRRVEVVLAESLTFPGETITSARFKCGPDVTAQVAHAVDHTRAMFAGWTPEQRTESCEALRGVTTGSYAWDIVQLHNQGWILGYRPLCASQGATPVCGDTVQVGTECYYAGSANYVIFGTMCRLCYDHFYALHRAGATIGYTGYMDFTESSMIDLIDLYKSGSRNVVPSKSWAVAGRDGWPTGGTPPPGDRPGCAPECSVPYTGPDFDVNWYPYEFHTGR
jgi:outer membrane protein OmpA-like peptidoglycan-associated protein